MTQQTRTRPTKTRPVPARRTLEMPYELAASPAHRIDGRRPDLNPITILYGIQLTWTIGANSGGEWPPPDDWNNGSPPYPHHYEVWLNGGDIKQTVELYWPEWAPGWQWARTHWVCLGTDPGSEYRVQIRAKHEDGSWGPLTDQVTVHLTRSRSLEYRNPYALKQSAEGVIEEGEAEADTPGAFHGSTGHPVSRALLVLGDPPDNPPSDAPICEEARKECGSPLEGAIWQQVVPPAEALIRDPAFSEAKGFLEYRKYFRTGSDELYLRGLAAAANPVFAGLNLVSAEAGLPDWPVTELSSSASEHIIRYRYSAHHVGHTWTHQWFVTRDDWDQDRALYWDQLESTPFMVENFGQDNRHHVEYATEALARRKTGRHVIVNVWGGHGGPDIPGTGTKAGEFFLSTSDVEFV